MKKGWNIGKLLVAAAGVAALLAGCASTKPFLGFIATTGYVDQKMQVQSEANQQSLDKIEADLLALRSDINKFQDQTGQIKQLVEELAKTQEQTRQLEKLASTVGDKIASLPRDTLLQLADLIHQQLGTGGPAASSAR